ncbi:MULTISPECIES: YchJ family metal-binding protein [unclassified Caballeronia]|uniref:YchJ family metal-binding protein n=1 Tax=unclassified Caballeronia TaxID=2646786 RepID=UPI00285A62F5|nr:MULTISPECIES: YchJ family metal-binding protein [unclassified Caballeronia]MDR5749328.1 YchJ family metal-binding protein [Caballeronia sp. LZ024]MDR5843541.1 YchJ family metal-binding protein [Caballeronia sp. LZ031]
MKPLECPCGGASPERRPNDRAPLYADCCARFVEGRALPATAMELMRSRYTAYVLGDTPYLRATWADETRPPDLDASADPATRWLGLQIRRHEQTDANYALVEFVARYKVGGRAHRLHETSRFVRNAEARWLYIDGEVNNA